ncbi:DUF6358 family protein [Pedobacter cryoconitis]|uniref:Flp pilus assembly protein TadB n=1 Tax=Pedobacter cryoconitis TaxID=188932 RepID=A0A7X0MJI7_9SPHI|nr:DUF6358 family protein [Pedobacter cryoconitis]MBB6499670.1 Flp pilus assembly protein TadB [Pedobacter cryoconitis]
MKKKIALNTFYTLGIVVSVIGLKWAFQNANYPVVALLIATSIFFLYLKINIVKEVRSGIKEKENSLKTPAVKDETN